MNVALYLRVSTEQQIEKYGLDVQHEKLRSTVRREDGPTSLTISMVDTVVRT